MSTNYCDGDPESYFEIFPGMFTSIGTETCAECGELIHVGVEHYLGFSFKHDEFAGDVHTAKYTFCEECGDLIDSFLASVIAGPVATPVEI